MVKADPSTAQTLNEYFTNGSGFISGRAGSLLPGTGLNCLLNIPSIWAINSKALPCSENFSVRVDWMRSFGAPLRGGIQAFRFYLQLSKYPDTPAFIQKQKTDLVQGRTSFLGATRAQRQLVSDVARTFHFLTAHFGAKRGTSSISRSVEAY